MSVSESLRKLSERAKLAEDHEAAAKSQARADLERTVNDVRAQAEAGAAKVQADAQKASSDMAATWDDVQRSWKAHVDKDKSDIELSPNISRRTFGAHPPSIARAQRLGTT